LSANDPWTRTLLVFCVDRPGAVVAGYNSALFNVFGFFVGAFIAGEDYHMGYRFKGSSGIVRKTRLYGMITRSHMDALLQAVQTNVARFE